ncbi:MAG: chorismate lyase [Pseudomonadota bacterium]
MKHPRTSSWFQESAIAVRTLEPDVISWLCDQGSLTRRLVERCGDQFSVRVLSQEWIQPAVDEARLLKVPLRQKAVLRQVQLLCGSQVLVYARSIIPLATLQGPHRRLKHLGTKPLGGYLFAQASLKREQQQLATITRNNPLFEIALPGDKENRPCIWGRRSLFTLSGKSLLVSEYFLPELFNS